MMAAVDIAPFSVLAARPDAHLDELALAFAAQLRDDVDDRGALQRLDELAEEVRIMACDGLATDPLDVLTRVLGDRHGFAGDRDSFADPENSMLDIVLERRSGLPILLSVVYLEVARRAGIALAGVGLPSHFVVGRLDRAVPALLDPFAGGERIVVRETARVRPWSTKETTLRMLNNLVGSYTRRHDLGRAIRAAELRFELPSEGPQREALGAELRALRARLN